jgi:hypothetical protein
MQAFAEPTLPAVEIAGGVLASALAANNCGSDNPTVASPPA